MLDAGYRTGNGVLLAGGAGGEFATLRTDERKQVAETVVEEAAGRIPVVVGAQDTSWLRVLELARFSESIGAEAIQVGAPYYDPATVDDILNLFKSISDAVSVPLMIYNSWWTGQNADIGYEGVARAIEIANVGSLKWNSWAYWCYELVLRDFADRLAIVDNQVREVFSHEMGAAAGRSGLRCWPDHERLSAESSSHRTEPCPLPVRSLPTDNLRITPFQNTIHQVFSADHPFWSRERGTTEYSVDEPFSVIRQLPLRQRPEIEDLHPAGDGFGQFRQKKNVR